MRRKSFSTGFVNGRSMALFSLSVLLLLASCGGEPPSEPIDEPAGEPVTENGIAPEDSDSVGEENQPSSEPVSPDQAPVPTDGVAPLEFEPSADGSTASASGARLAAEPNRYTFTGEAGQILTIVLIGEPNVGFNLYRNDVTIDIDRSDSGRREWTLPENGEYEFRLFNGTEGSAFSFKAMLSATAAAQQPDVQEQAAEVEPSGATLDEEISLNPWGKTTAALNVESNVDGLVVINGIDLIQDAVTRQRLDIQTDGTVFYNEWTFIAQDINLDGLTDLRLVQFTPAGPNITYFYWLYEPDSDSFVRDISYEPLVSPEFVGNGQINTFYRGSATQYLFGRFRVTAEGPKPVGRQVCEYLPQEDGSVLSKNSGYVFDDAGVETLVFEENSEGDCLPYKATP